MAKRVYRKRSLLPWYFCGPISTTASADQKLTFLAEHYKLGIWKEPVPVSVEDQLQAMTAMWRALAECLARDCVDGFDGPREVRDRGRKEGSGVDRWALLKTISELKDSQGSAFNLTDTCRFLASPKGKKQYPQFKSAERRTLENIFRAADKQIKRWKSEARDRAAHDK